MRKNGKYLRLHSNKLLELWEIRNINFKCVCATRGVFLRRSLRPSLQRKIEKNPEATESIDVAVKHPNGLHQVEYEIATLEKVNEHYNILRFWGQVDYPPNRYGDGDLYLYTLLLLCT